MNYERLQFQHYEGEEWKEQYEIYCGNAFKYDGKLFYVEYDWVHTPPVEFDPNEGNYETRYIYFDAAFSSMPINSCQDAASSDYYYDYQWETNRTLIPNGNDGIIYYAIFTDGGTAKYGEMERIGESNIYRTPIAYGVNYTKIIFSGSDFGYQYYYEEPMPNYQRGGSTLAETIPEIENPIFVADPHDPIIYYENFLGGYNRDNYPLNDGNPVDGNKYRSWYQFRIFDTALSAKYQAADTIPLYVGQFQPDWRDNEDDEYGYGYPYYSIADAFMLYGYVDNADKFLSVNNAIADADGKGTEGNYHYGAGSGHYAYAAQGLVSAELSNDNLAVKGGSAVMPLFDKSFLRGGNTYKAILGGVYEDVAFPFAKKTDENGVDHWHFDSSETTVELKRDGSSYFLDEVTGDSQKAKFRNLDASSTYEGTSCNDNEYGFFPFNGGATANRGDTYNFGFGARIDFDFTLAEDGMLTGTNGEREPITFTFRGDDDLWVFVDGKLILDVGGDHGEVTGTINFKDMKSTVSKVKSSWGSTASGENVETAFELTGANTDTHKMTIFYLERGMWGSNIAIDFNFPKEETPAPATYDLTVTEEIYGEAPRTDEFTFTVTIANPDYDLPTEYEVIGSRYDRGATIVFEPVSNDSPNSAGGGSGEAALKATFTLGHDETVTIKGLPDGTEYNLIQSGGDSRYETKVNGTLKGDRTATGTFDGDNVTVAFANGYTTSTPTPPPPPPSP